MKMSSKLMAAALVLALVGAVAPAWANVGKDHKEQCQMLRDASAALKDTNPELSRKLNDFVEEKEEWKEKERKMLDQKRQDLQKIETAADRLNASDRGLADDLNDIADRLRDKIEEKSKY